MTSSSPAVRPLPSLSRRLLLGLGVAALPVATVAVPQIARAEPVDPSLEEGETRIDDVVLADVAVTADDPDGPLRRIEGIAATMVGCTWAGEAPDHVRVRTRGEDGTWSTWTDLEQAVNPDTGDAATGTEPAWFGGVYAVDVRAARDGADVTSELTAHIVTTAPRAQDAGLAPAGVPGSTGRVGSLGTIASTSGGLIGPNAPTIISRAQWGADESLVGGTSGARELKAIVVHHTEGAAPSSPERSAELVRGILTYHAKTLGWADIGYNFLVDPFGQIFEARHGGLDRHIAGAHARGFNTGTCGISVMGSYMSSPPSQAAMDAVSTLAAWKLLGAMRAGVNERQGFEVTVDNVNFPKGTTVALPRFFGHRDVNSTDCPGNAFYARLGTLRSSIQQKLDTGWRVHLDTYVRDGGEAALGTVVRIAHPDGPYTATVLTKSLILSTGPWTAASYGTSFASDWSAAWGRPTGGARVSGGVELQAFENGTAVREGSRVSFVTTRFRDVPRGMMFASEIESIAARGITTGYDDLTYRPFQAIGRDAMIAFIYRAKGSPAFTPPARSPFRDITPQTQFYREICWAVSRGIVTGFPDGTFRPTLPVERQAVAAFLYRAAGSPAVPSGAPTFTDVPPTHQFRKEISWLASTGISTGWPDRTFRPVEPIKRDAMAAFIVRWMKVVGL